MPKDKKKTPPGFEPPSQEEQDKRIAEGNAFIRAREKARARGADKKQAAEIAAQQTEGKTARQITPEEFNLQREEKLSEAGLISPEDSDKPIGQPDTIQVQEFDAQGKPIFSGGVSSAQGLVENVAGGGAAAIALGSFFKIAGKKISNIAGKEVSQVLTGTAAIKEGTAAKWTSLLKSPLGVIASLYAAINLAKNPLDFLTRKVEDQQQKLNTLGQITSTIVGDSTTGTGDARKGLQELRFLKQEILRLEQEIKRGRIKDFILSFDGRIIDIEGDIYDQLSTINEGIRDLESFQLQGLAPELTPQQQQEAIRELEGLGILEPIDLTEARR